VHEGEPRVGEGVPELRLELGREADLGNQDERLRALLERLRDQVQVHLGLAAAGHAMQEKGAEPAERCA